MMPIKPKEWKANIKGSCCNVLHQQYTPNSTIHIFIYSYSFHFHSSTFNITKSFALVGKWCEYTTPHHTPYYTSYTFWISISHFRFVIFFFLNNAGSIFVKIKHSNSSNRNGNSNSNGNDNKSRVTSPGDVR